MPAEAEDRISPAVRGRSTTRGDVPDHLQRRYYTDERGGPGTGFYADARVQHAAFRDRGRELVSTRLDPNAIRDMAAIAQHRGWTIVQVRGSNDFRREAWLAGRAIGLEVQGYRPTERDLQELQRRQARADDRREVRAERREEQRERAHDRRTVQSERREDDAAERQLRVVDTVLKARVEDPERRAQIMDAARNRIASWLERGAQFDAFRADRAAAQDRQRVR